MRSLRRKLHPQGLYHPDHEHDSCGVGFVVQMNGVPSNDILRKGIEVLNNLTHRGACGCDPLTGDGAGILFQIPHAFFEKECSKLDILLPRPGEYAVGMVFLPREVSQRDACEQAFEKIVRREGQRLLGWREVPVDPSECGPQAREIRPEIRQIFIAPGRNVPARDGAVPRRASQPRREAEGGGVFGQDAFERKLLVIRKQIETWVRGSNLRDADAFHIPSLSSRTIVYKGLLISHQIPRFYLDLRNPMLASAIAMVHQRFSTNTLPSWDRAHPYRFLCHNGEINTLRGNINWMHARQALFQSPLFKDDVKKILPVISPGGSDSAMFDNALELLVHTGRSLPHAIMMMIPEAWQKHQLMEETKRAFYEYHACLVEPWDGPASIAFTDGRVIGAVLDRNGLRPSRYVVTKDGLVIMASEVGVLDIPPENILQKGRLQPGRMFLVDLSKGRIVADEEIKAEIVARKPYRRWLDDHLVKLEDLPSHKTVPGWPTVPGAPRKATPTSDDFSARRPRSGAEGAPEGALPDGLPAPELLRRQLAHGYTLEDLRLLMMPMALNGQDAVGSMGVDTPLAVLSERPQLLFNYFKQLFAQVTNPPIDPLREDLVMSVETTIGPERNLFEETPEHARKIRLASPTLTNEELARLKELNQFGLTSHTIPTLFEARRGPEGLRSALEDLCRRASEAVDGGATILILSDRGMDEAHAAIPSLLAVSAVHHHLIREGKRVRAGLVIETGEPREVMHFCLLMGYGAGAFNPYLAYESVRQLVREGIIKEVDEEEAVARYRKAVDKGLLKVATKMGISTLQSYRGAQIFEAIGINKEVIDRYFTWTASRIEGIGLDTIARESLIRHEKGFGTSADAGADLEVGGQYQWRRRGEFHLLNPDTIGKLQHAVRAKSPSTYKEFAEMVNNQNQRLTPRTGEIRQQADPPPGVMPREDRSPERLATIRGLLRFKPGKPVPLNEVEPAAEIVKRFATGAMSLGSISREAHETLAVAMNRIGGKSNTGEGGEDPERYLPDPNGDSRRSAIKQVASARFGVTIGYLVNCDDLQIKIAQGAKPGEGGQLPGHKVSEYIAKVRYSVPGVGLISPPPHHDIYSIEDIAQLIHDLKNANPRARIHVKLVAEVGVGTVAAGVAKAKADVVLISGYEGGTGASPLTSIQHAGIPWELGLAETQQVLVMNGLRGRIIVQTDGKMQTGRDVAIAALLGAEEFGFSTLPLVALGCIMMRVCHLNTCPVGIATQDPVLRKKFAGRPEDVINYFFFVAEELREIMAELGFRNVADMVGRTDKLEMRDAIDHWKAKGLDFTPLLHKVESSSSAAIRCVEAQDHSLEKALDHVLIQLSREAIDGKKPVEIRMPIRNSNRCVGTMLSGEIAKKHGDEGLPPETIQIYFQGSAGQSFGAFLARGVSMTLEGDANDYTAKGLSGGRVVVHPPPASTFVAEENILVGNVVLYGATGGEAYFRGIAGERFAVRNSGATAVVEGVGDHGCEYMTRGTVAVLGRTGRNFAAGMSGGVAYVLDVDRDFRKKCNTGMVELQELMDPTDVSTVHRLLQRHLQFTKSAVAERVLQRWEDYRTLFVKVMPVEYKKVLAHQHLSQEALRLAAV